MKREDMLQEKANLETSMLQTLIQIAMPFVQLVNLLNRCSYLEQEIIKVTPKPAPPPPKPVADGPQPMKLEGVDVDAN